MFLTGCQDGLVGLAVGRRLRLQIAPHELGGGLPAGIALVVVVQDAGFRDRVEAGIPNREVDLTAHNVSLTAVDLGPLDATRLHVARNVARKSIARLVVVIVAVKQVQGRVSEHRQGIHGTARAPLNLQRGEAEQELPALYRSAVTAQHSKCHVVD